MATEGSHQLSERNIVQLAAAIAAKDMKTIAEGYLGIAPETVKNIQYENGWDAEAFNRDIIRHWANKNSGPEQVKTLASILYKAAKEGSYVDPNKVQEILHISEEDLRTDERAGPENEDEMLEKFKDFIDDLKEDTAETMKIQVSPWDESDMVDMEDLYTDLTLEQVEYKPTGPTSVKLDNYMQLFEERATMHTQEIHTPQEPQRKSKRKHKGKKILAKGEFGMGKSSFGRKMAYDWAKGVFTAVSVVFFVSMKLIRPGQSIENIIIDQTPVIEGLGVDEPKLKSILEGLGNKSLIIFDGLDEYDLRRSDDVGKIVEGRKLLYCNIILTSRPHAVDRISRYFPTQVRIDGFSKENAEHFVTKYVANPAKSLDCLNFHRNNFTFVFVHSSRFCPLLLLFICTLVDNDEKAFADKFIPLGEIYMKLVLFIYRKYCTKTGQKYDENKFATILKQMGKIAWRMLRSRQGWVKEDDVIGEVGDDAIKFGLLTRHRSFRRESTDVQFTFAHVTIQEFMGSLGFLQLIDQGESIDSLLGDDHEGKLILKSPLFLRFCLWLLSDSCRNEYLEFSDRDTVYNSLLGYVANIVNIIQMDLGEIAEMFHILRVPFTETEENLFLLKFIQGVLSMCDKTKELYFSFVSFFPVDRLSNLLRCFPPHTQDSNTPEKSITLLESSTNHKALNKVLDRCGNLGYHPDMLLEGGILTDLSDCLHSSLRMLCLFDTYKFASRVITEKQILPCPFLTDILLDVLHVDESALMALDSAVKFGHLPLLGHLRFRGCGFSLAGKLHKLFHSLWPTLTYLGLDRCQLNQRDIETLTNCLAPGANRKLPKLESLVLFVNSARNTRIHVKTLKTLFQKALANIKGLGLYSLSKEEYRSIAAAINLGHLPSLAELSISMTTCYDQTLDIRVAPSQVHRYAIKRLSSLNSASLTNLTLHRFVCSPSHLTAVAMGASRSMLTELDISHSIGVTGALSKLLCHSYPSLRILIMCNCGLDSKDLRSLSQANKENKLQELIHLDVSQNAKCVGHLQNLFLHDQKWERLLSLNVSQFVESAEDFQSLIPLVQNGALVNLTKLALSTNNTDAYMPRCMGVKWQNIQLLHIHCACRNGSSDHVKVIDQITKAVETDFLPHLQTLRVTSVFISKRYDPMLMFESFKNYLKTASSRDHLDKLARTSSSLLTTASSSENDDSYHLFLRGLKNLRVMPQHSSTEEYSICGHFVTKITLISSFSGHLPDLKSLLGVMHESVDNSPHFQEAQRKSLKSLGEAICSSWYSWFYGEPLDLQKVCQALIECTENCLELSPCDATTLKSLINLIPSLMQKQKEAFESAFKFIDAWIGQTPCLSRLVFKELWPAVRLALDGQPLDLQALRRLLHSLINNDPTMADPSRLPYKYCLDVVCISMEAVVNRRPVDFQQAIQIMYEWIDNTPSLQPYRYSCKRAAEILFVLLQCWLNCPLNLQPLRDLMHEWIDNNLDLSESERFDFKCYADELYRQIQSLISRRASILDVLPSSSDPNDRSLSMRAQYLIDASREDPSVSELRVLIHGLRKRGIRVYMYHTAHEEP